ncbi:MAG: helix-turn-helix transcriptional regulator [Aeromonadales bacterium]|nr:helix-turn-helix transcriptional regulator [Aeromonadales bacterium]
MTKDTIGMRIKNALYAKRMTSFEIASKAQISEGGLSQIINGKIKNLKVDTAIRIATALDMPLLKLIFGKDEDICEDSALYDKDY